MSTWRSFLLGRGDFFSPRKILRVITQSKNYDPDREDYNDAEGLLIFQTSRQQTWLVVTRFRLYCLLDDLTKPNPKVRWSTASTKLIKDRKIIAEIKMSDQSEKSGLLQINEHTGWLFSKKLFTVESIEDQVRKLISSKMR